MILNISGHLFTQEPLSSERISLRTLHDSLRMFFAHLPSECHAKFNKHGNRPKDRTLFGLPFGRSLDGRLVSFQVEAFVLSAVGANGGGCVIEPDLLPQLGTRGPQHVPFFLP